MSGIASWQAEIKLDINDLKKRLSEAEKELGEVTEKEHKVKLDIDTKTLDSAIKKLDKMLDSIGKGTGDFKQFENLGTQLESITSDVKSLSNVFSKIDDSKLQGLFSSIQNIDNTLDKLSTHILSVGQNMNKIGSDNGIKDAIKNTQNLAKANEEAAKSAEKLANTNGFSSDVKELSNFEKSIKGIESSLSSLKSNNIIKDILPNEKDFDDILSKLDLTKSKLGEIAKITEKSHADKNGKFFTSYVLQDKNGSTEIYGENSTTDRGQLVSSSYVGYNAKDVTVAKKYEDKFANESNKRQQQIGKKFIADQQQYESIISEINSSIAEADERLSKLPVPKELDAEYLKLIDDVGRLNEKFRTSEIQKSEYDKNVRALTSDYSNKVKIQQNRDYQEYIDKNKAEKQTKKDEQKLAETKRKSRQDEKTSTQNSVDKALKDQESAWKNIQSIREKISKTSDFAEIENLQQIKKGYQEQYVEANKVLKANSDLYDKELQRSKLQQIKTDTDKKIAEPKNKEQEQAKSKAKSYIESAQKRLKNAISKYDYGDTSEASAELEKLGKAWANFATKDNPNPTLEQVEARMKEIDNTIASIISKLKTDHTSNLKKLNDEIKDEDKSKKKKDSEKKKKTSDENATKWSTFNNDLNKTKKSEERKLQGKSINKQAKSIEQLEKELEDFHTQGIISEKQFTDAINKINGIKQHLQDMKDDINKNFTDNLDKSVEKYQKELDKRQNKPENQNQGKPYKDALNEFSSKLKELEAIQTKIRNNNGLVAEEDKTSVEELTKKIEKYSDALKNMSAANKGSTEISRQKELQKIGDYLQRNTKISEEAKAKLKAYMTELKSGSASTNIEHIHTEFLKIAQAEREAGREGKSFFSVIKEKVFYGAAGSIASYFGINDLIQYGRQGIETVRELNTALTEMRKVSNESLGTLKEYQSTTFDTANDVGTTAKQIQDSTADYMRLGESLQDAAESAKTANVLLNVSEFDNIEDATKSLVSMGQAYKDLDKMSIVDRLNEIGNNYSISTDELASGLQKSAATLSLMGNTIDEAAALITTANSVIQDSDSVSAGLRTISLRLVGTEESEQELSAMNEEVDAFVKSTNSKKQQIIKDYTAVASNNYQGFDILDSNGNYKNTYQILLGISKIYKEIQEQDKKLGTNHAVALVEELAGKNRSNIASAILQDPTQLEAVKKSSENAQGSAANELNSYLDSIDGKMAQLENRGQEFWFKLIDSDAIKNGISLLTSLINLATKFVDTIGAVPTLFAGISTFFSLNNVGRDKIHSLKINNLKDQFADNIHNLLWIQRFRVCYP